MTVSYTHLEKVRRLIEDMEERKALLFEPDEKSLKAFRENRVKRAGNIKGPKGNVVVVKSDGKNLYLSNNTSS